MLSYRNLLAVFFALTSFFAQANTDSLWGVWNKKQLHDTTRLNALNQMTSKLQYVRPDSAQKLAQLMLENAKQMGVKKYQGTALGHIGFAYMNMGQFTPAIEYFRKANEVIDTKTNGKSIAGNLINTGSCYSNMSMYDSAFHYFDLGVALCEEIGEVEFRVNALINVGSLHMNLGNFRLALDKFDKAIPVAKENKNLLGLAGAYANKGMVLDRMGNTKDALDFLDKSLMVQREVKNPQGIAFVEKVLGEIYLDQAEYTMAKKHLSTGLKIAREVGEKQLEAGLLVSMGMLYTAEGKDDSSFTFDEEAFRIANEIGAASSALAALNNMGAYFQKKGDFKTAQSYFEQYLEISQMIGNPQKIIGAKLNLGGNYQVMGNLKKAVELVEDALQMAQQYGDLEKIWQAADNLTRIYALLGRNEKALQMHILYATIKDSLFKEENKNASIRREFKFQYEQQALTDSLQHAQEQAIKDAEIKRRKTSMRALTAGLILMLLFAVVFLMQRMRIAKEKAHSDELLHNILPEEVAAELKATGEAEAKLIHQSTVLFTDFKGFTEIASYLNPKELVEMIHDCFSAFDHIMEKHGIEKIKTIGDAYMAAGGLPKSSDSHAVDVIEAALEICAFIMTRKQQREAQNQPFFEIRVGVHSGPVVAGIVGVKKFQYDIWGDTVNTASRMESNGAPGEVNISEDTYQILKDNPNYAFEHRGKIHAKGKGEVDMYFVRRV